MNPKFILEQEGEVALTNPQESDVEAALAKLHPLHHSFVSIITSQGSYVQVAGAPLKLTVEFRCVNQKSFHHFVLGRCSDDTKLVAINCSCGPIIVQRSEILHSADAIKILVLFLKTGLTPPEYVLRDVTVKFQP